MRPAGFLATLLIASPAIAWNAAGHRVIAAIAYERLNPRTRARVDDLLAHHPDYTNISGREAFIAAAVWPDMIKSDPRFYEETGQNVIPTQLLPGFPDMQRHRQWHWYNTPYTPDRAHTRKPAEPNAFTELTRMFHEMDAVKPYDIPWIIHLVGDVHQPLHCIDRFLHTDPQGDDGGNRVFVSPGRNLHAFWDDLPGANTSDYYITQFAMQLTGAHAPPAELDLNPRDWIAEGAKLAKSDVYSSVGPETGDSQHPIHLSETYQQNARALANKRLALAGYRLAAVLNQKLR